MVNAVSWKKKKQNTSKFRTTRKTNDIYFKREKKESKIKHNKSVVSFLLYYILKGQHWGHIGKRKNKNVNLSWKCKLTYIKYQELTGIRREGMQRTQRTVPERNNTRMFRSQVKRAIFFFSFFSFFFFKKCWSKQKLLQCGLYTAQRPSLTILRRGVHNQGTIIM